MIVLELFKGTGSVGKVFEKAGHTVMSLDINPKANPDILADILNWNYKAYPPHIYDLIWASPPCQQYSHLLYVWTKRGKVRDLEKADKIVLKVLEIIDYFKPTVWIIENPQTGLLKNREFMSGLPFYDVSYCRYGFDYRKQTRLWSNLVGFEPKVCRMDCDKMVDGRHPKSVGNNQRRVNSLNERYAIPPALIESLLDAVERMAVNRLL